MELKEQHSLAKAWLKDLSAVLKVKLEFDEDNLCTFQLQEDSPMAMELSQDLPIINIYGPLLNLPAEDMDMSFLLMSRALELNAFQSLTRGGAIATVPGEGLLIFCYVMSIEGGSSELLIQLISNFAETLEELKQNLQIISQKSAAISKQIPPKPPLQMLKV